VTRFKKRHKIVTRKVTKFVTKAVIENEVGIREAAQNFVVEVKVRLHAEIT